MKVAKITLPRKAHISQIFGFHSKPTAADNPPTMSKETIMGIRSLTEPTQTTS